jgi:hypothetical protein
MGVEEVFQASEAAARTELAEAEAALLECEAAVRMAKEELSVHLVERAALQEALATVGARSPAAVRLHRRLFGLRHIEGALSLTNANLVNAKRRVDHLNRMRKFGFTDRHRYDSMARVS